MLSLDSFINDYNISAEPKQPSWRTFSDSSKRPSTRHRAYLISKRLIDILISVFVLSFTWPLILCIAIYIRKKSSASAIFKQIRIGKNRRSHINSTRYFLAPRSGKLLSDRRKHKDVFRTRSGERRKSNPGKLYYLCPKDRKIKSDRRKTNSLGRSFIFYKFRTMYPDAKEQFPELYAYHYTKKEIKHMKFKIENDPRVPKWAKWLRQSSLDELPNFVNVLLGDMSVVGPRPDIPEMMKYYTGAQSMKLSVKPGITGLAQVEGRGHLSFQEAIKCDVEYAKNQSFLLDMKIIIRTIRECFHHNGAF